MGLVYGPKSRACGGIIYYRDPKQLRKKYGIEVVFAQMPQTGAYMDQAFEAIMSAFDYIHSQQSKAKAKGVANMKQNVRQGYRAGRAGCTLWVSA